MMTRASTESIGALLDKAATAPATRTALVVGGRRVSYAALRDDAMRAACGLAALGVGKGTHVGLLLPNSAEWLACAFGAFKLGAILVPLNTLFSARELGYALNHADVTVLVTAARFLRHAYLDTLVELCPALRSPAPNGLCSPEFPALRRVVVAGIDTAPPGAMTVGACLDAGKDVPLRTIETTTRACRATDAAAIFFTSGSTALPKAVVHTHGSMLISAENIRDALGLTAEDVTWGCLPFFFTGGLVAIALASMRAGAAVVLQDVFAAAEALRLLETAGCTVMFGWPHQIQAMIEHPTYDRTRLRVRKGVGANAPWAASIYPPDHEAVGTYGMTESGPMCAATRWDDPLELRIANHGRPMPGVELRIVDPATGTELPPRTEGEIVLRGTTMMRGYYKLPPHEGLDADGFFHTGDRGWFDESGHLHFVGRIKDVIKTAGVNVATSEIEAVLRQHPRVREAYVVGVPHPTRGENPAAFVVPEADVTADVLIAFCRERLASYKVPRHIFFRQDDTLPLAGSGKVLKQRLREEAMELVRSQ